MSQEKKNERAAAPELSWSEQQEIRIDHLRQLEAQGLNPYGSRFVRTMSAAQVKERYQYLEPDQEAPRRDQLSGAHYRLARPWQGLFPRSERSERSLAALF